jgi:hypothetical protein
MDELNTNERTKNEIRKLFMESVGAPPANDRIPACTELNDARRRVNLAFGQALIGLSVVPVIAGFSFTFDPNFTFIFWIFAVALLAVGAFYIDRANAADKALIKEWLSK